MIPDRPGRGTRPGPGSPGFLRRRGRASARRKSASRIAAQALSWRRAPSRVRSAAGIGCSWRADFASASISEARLPISSCSPTAANATLKKVPSSVDDYARAIIEGLAALLAEIGAEPGAIAELLHGTTVASNAILEHKGARTGLITTRGFRDVLEIRNLRMPRLYDMSWTKPPPLVERRLRVEVDERVNAQGGIDRPLDEASVERAVRFLVGEGVEAIAVCLLHSYPNPAHEHQGQGDRGASGARGQRCRSAPRYCRSSTNTSAARRRSSMPMSGRSSSAI